MKEILIVDALFYVKVTLPAAFPVQSAKQRHCSMTKIKIIERDLRNSNKCSIVAADFVPKILYKWDKSAIYTLYTFYDFEHVNIYFAIYYAPIINSKHRCMYK